jgi:Fic family protein
VPLPEFPSRIEPCLLDEARGRLLDLVTELPAATQQLAARLHPHTAAQLARLVRIMNCYYSNLIEGHNTRPRDIERALRDDLDADSRRRDLQREAIAHIRVQALIDRDAAAGTLRDAASLDFVVWLHREFYHDAPESALHMEIGDRIVRVSPGALRSEPGHDVAVGRHVPPSSDAVRSFMEYFEKRYCAASLSPAQRLLAIPAAHHRFNYIHPFLDGNGRVSRLMSHAMAYEAGIAAHGLWSISRGLARGLQNPTEYKTMMDLADAPRENDYDGRGNLSQRALVEFSTWFLEICLDQVRFMSRLFELDGLAERLLRYASQMGWRDEAGRFLVGLLHRGEIARGEVAGMTGLGERTARTLLGSLLRHGIVGSLSEKGPVSLRFPIEAQDVLFPRLFLGE